MIPWLTLTAIIAMLKGVTSIGGLLLCALIALSILVTISVITAFASAIYFYMVVRKTLKEMVSKIKERSDREQLKNTDFTILNANPI